MKIESQPNIIDDLQKEEADMKKVFMLVMLAALIVIFTSCVGNVPGRSIFKEDNEKIADATFEEIIDAIQSNDASKIVDMFSDSIKSENDLSQDASKFIECIQGEIISFTTAFESGVGSDYKIENEKKRKEVQSSFCINTTENRYYVAMKECTRDEISNDIGLLSIYIIDSDNWTEDYVYRGDGEWNCGINVMD